VQQNTRDGITYNFGIFLKREISRSANIKLRVESMTQNGRHSSVFLQMMRQKFLHLHGKTQRSILKFVENLNRYYIQTNSWHSK